MHTPPQEAKKQKQVRTPFIDQMGLDLTAMARAGKLDPVIGRQKEIERVIQILSRRTKNNPVLVGEPGVGKTAIVEGLAQRLVTGDIPRNLLDKRLLMLDMGTLVAGTMYRGQFEERLKQVIKEIKDSTSILFIDEIHTLVGAGSATGTLDAANILKPALARGELQCIGATTMDDYRKYIEHDAALERRFQPVHVDQPNVEETIQILHGLKSRYEAHHGVTYTDEAIKAAAELSARYVADRFLPDKAIDLIDEAGSRVRLYKGAGAVDGVAGEHAPRSKICASRRKMPSTASSTSRLRPCATRKPSCARRSRASRSSPQGAGDEPEGDGRGHRLRREHVDGHTADAHRHGGVGAPAADGRAPAQAHHRPGRGDHQHRTRHPPRPRRTQRPQAAHGLVPVPGPNRRRQVAAWPRRWPSSCSAAKTT